MKQFISYILGFSFLFSSPAFSLILLDQEMTPEEQKKSGISKLSEQEQRHLEEGLNDNFHKKSEYEQNQFGSELYVSEVINDGQQLRLSDNTLYEIAPEDWVHAQAWIALAKVQVIHSKDEYYPFSITNPLSGYTVRARLIASEHPSEVPIPKDEEDIIQFIEKEQKAPNPGTP